MYVTTLLLSLQSSQAEQLEVKFPPPSRQTCISAIHALWCSSFAAGVHWPLPSKHSAAASTLPTLTATNTNPRFPQHNLNLAAADHPRHSAILTNRHPPQYRQNLRHA